MKEYRIDFNKVKSLWDLHQALKDGLNLPSYYGMNMDALWDCLTWDIEDPATIYLIGLKSLPKELNEKVRIMMEAFDEAVEWYAKVNSYIRVVVVD